MKQNQPGSLINIKSVADMSEEEKENGEYLLDSIKNHCKKFGDAVMT